MQFGGRIIIKLFSTLFKIFIVEEYFKWSTIEVCTSKILIKIMIFPGYAVFDFFNQFREEINFIKKSISKTYSDT